MHQNNKHDKLWCNGASNQINDFYRKLSTSKFTNIFWPIVTVYKTWLAHFIHVCWGWSSEKSVHIIDMWMKGSENDKRMDRRVHVEKPKDSAWEYSLSRYNIACAYHIRSNSLRFFATAWLIREATKWLRRISVRFSQSSSS